MLKQRILTAIILGPLILWSVVAFSHRAIAIELGIILTIAAWEWARLSGMFQQAGRIAYAIVIMLGMLGLTLLLHTRPDLLLTLLIFVSACWFFAFIVIIAFNRRDNVVVPVMSASRVVINALVGAVILWGAFIAIAGLHRASEPGYKFILILLAIIWIADSAAYFCGKAFGRHKLAARVSPGKTWEGVAGATVAIFIATLIIAQYLQYTAANTIAFMVIALVTMSVSIVGDLIESLFKRRAGVKDSSRLLPGHGGILDRIDSLMAAAPVFLLGLMLAGL